MMEEVMGLQRHGWDAPALSQLYEDPHTQASFISGAQPTLPQFSEAQGGTRRLVMKRKVLRHRPDGGVEVSESVTSESESDAEVWSLKQKMLQAGTAAEDSISEGEMETSSSSPDESPHQWPPADNISFLHRDFGSQRSLTSHYSPAAEEPKSFIPPRFESLGYNRGKTDRLAKYLEYKQEWDKFRVPGEDPRLGLRWVIREQMLCKPELPAKVQHPCVPNTYTVPTDKKRAALRWEVRWDLAKGLIPRRNSCM